jgi:hypothetical protein
MLCVGVVGLIEAAASLHDSACFFFFVGHGVNHHSSLCSPFLIFLGLSLLAIISQVYHQTEYSKMVETTVMEAYQIF